MCANFFFVIQRFDKRFKKCGKSIQCCEQPILSQPTFSPPSPSSIISSNSLTPMLISARYYMAYEFATKLSWWNKTISCGPVVEQATHFVDLLRYFGGEVQVDTIQTQTVEHFEIPGQLKKLGFDESSIKEEDRIPRSTVSTFKFESGGLGQLNHVVGLHGEVSF